MTKKETEEKLKEAIELLEMVHRNIYMGASVYNGKIELLEHSNYRNLVYHFVKSVNPESKLEFTKVANGYHLLA